jgi:hypothetical protein
VNPSALREATHLVDLMLARRPDAHGAMIQSGLPAIRPPAVCRRTGFYIAVRDIG